MWLPCVYERRVANWEPVLFFVEIERINIRSVFRRIILNSSFFTCPLLLLVVVLLLLLLLLMDMDAVEVWTNDTEDNCLGTGDRLTEPVLLRSRHFRTPIMDCTQLPFSEVVNLPPSTSKWSWKEASLYTHTIYF